MDDSQYLMDFIIEKAKEKNRLDIINTLKTMNGCDYLEKLTSLLNELDLSLVSKNNNDDYQQDILFRISRALTKKYFTIYYVNLINNHYVGYSSNDDYKSLKIEESGNDFFKSTIENAEKVVFKDDIERIQKALKKENLIRKTSGEKRII